MSLPVVAPGEDAAAGLDVLRGREHEARVALNRVLARVRAAVVRAESSRSPVDVARELLDAQRGLMQARSAAGSWHDARERRWAAERGASVVIVRNAGPVESNAARDGASGLEIA